MDARTSHGGSVELVDSAARVVRETIFFAFGAYWGGK